MGWMALLFAWFIVTVLRGQRERFAFGALVSGLLVLVALHVINPDALIVRTNLALMKLTGRFDGAYAASLGPEAIPPLVESLPELPEDERRKVTENLQGRAEHLAARDWRSWNWGWSRAADALEALAAGQDPR